MSQIKSHTNKTTPRYVLIVTYMILTLLFLLLPKADIGGHDSKFIAEAAGLRSTRLEAKLIQAKSFLVSSNKVQSEFLMQIRAHGGDVLLPAYNSDIVVVPKYSYPKSGSNAVVLQVANIEVLHAGGQEAYEEKDGRYVLKEYQSATLKITAISHIMPLTISDKKIIFATELKSIIWKPITQELNEDPLGNPRLDMTSVEFATNPVIVLGELSGQASIANVLKSLLFTK